MTQQYLRTYFDGGCTKFGIMSACVIVIADDHAYIHSGIVGRGNSLQAEWTALLNAVVIAKTLLVDRGLELAGDNVGVIEMASGTSPMKGESNLGFKKSFDHLIQDLADVRFDWVRRDNNLAGRYLEAGATQWFVSGLTMLESVEEYSVLPLPQSLGLHDCVENDIAHGCGLV